LLGTMDPQIELFDADELCGHLVPAESIHRKLADLGDRLFSDADFADMYEARGRHSVPPSLLAKVMLLQTFEGTSDRETLHHVRCDLSWKVALHLPLQDEGFHHTVLTYFRERLRRSERPKRIFERFREVAIEAGLLTKRGTSLDFSLRARKHHRLQIRVPERPAEGWLGRGHGRIAWVLTCSRRS
jgi:transposase